MERKLSLSERGNELLTAQARAWAQSHLPSSGKRGRPAYLSEYVEWLLQERARRIREEVGLSQPPRAQSRADRVRKVDREATAAFARAWRTRPSKLRPYPEVVSVVRQVAPNADRPQRVARVARDLVEHHVLASFNVHEDRTWAPELSPRLDLIPDYHYTLWAWAQTTLGDFP